MHRLMWGPLPQPSQLLQDSTEGAQKEKRVGNPSRRNLGNGKMPAATAINAINAINATTWHVDHVEMWWKFAATAAQIVQDFLDTGRTCWILSDLQRLGRWTLYLVIILVYLSVLSVYLHAMLNSCSLSHRSHLLEATALSLGPMALTFPYFAFNLFPACVVKLCRPHKCQARESQPSAGGQRHLFGQFRVFRQKQLVPP